MAQEVGALYITLKLKDDDFERGLNDAKKSASGFGSSLAGASEKLFYMGNAAKMVVGTLVGVTSQMVDMANQGIKIAQTAASFDKLAGSAADADAWVRSIQDASRGATTEFEATNMAIQLMTMGLASTADEAGRMTEIATITKAINPELGSMENTLMNIGMTLANDSWARLDQLGVDAGLLKERMAELEQQGYATTEAFDVGVMEQLEANAKVIGTDVLEIGRNTTEMQTKFREAKDAAAELALVIMEQLSPHLSIAFTAADQILQTLTNLANGTWEFDVVMNAILNELGPTRSELGTQLTAQNERGARGGFDQMATFGFTDTATLTRNPVSTGGFSMTQAEAMPVTVTNPDEIKTEFPTMPEGWQAGQTETADTTTAIDALIASKYTPPVIEISNIIATSADGSTSAGNYDSLQSSTALAAESVIDSIMTAVRDMSPTVNLKGSVSETNTAISRGEQNSRLTPGINAISAALGESDLSVTADDAERMAQYAADFSESMRAAAAEAASFDSLAEKFGQGASSFDVDVYREMQTALGGVDVEGTAAADALLYYQLQTGMATGSSEAFSTQMATLAQALADGTLSAEEYVQQVQQLGQADLSAFDTAISALTATGDMSGVQTVLDMMAAIDPGQMDEFSAALEGVLAGEGDTSGITALLGMMGNLDEEQLASFAATLQELQALTVAPEGEAETDPLALMLTQAEQLQESMSTVMDPALEDMDAFKQGVADTMAGEYRVGVTFDVSTSPETVSSLADLVLDELDRRSQ